MVWRGRGPFSHHIVLSLTREGGEGAVTGQENRKHMQEDYMHQQMKTDFKPIIKINVRCSRTEKILSLPICQA